MSIRIDGTNTTANPGITGSDTDTGLQFGTNEVKVVTDGNDRVTVDSSGRLLAGTTSNSGNFRAVFEGNAGNAAAGGDILLCRGSTTPLNGQALGLVGMSDGTQTISAQVQAFRDGGTWSSSSKPTALRFSTAADGGTSMTERLRITSDGTIKLASGCPGIDFSQIQTNTAGMTSETLDSYEEGTFTGSFNNSDNDATVSHGNQTGYYVKVGNLVHFSLYFDDIDVSATGSTTNARIFGLPFTSLGSSQHYSVVNIIHNTILTSSAGGYVNTNQSHIIPTNVGTTTTSTFSTGTNFRLMIGGTYRAA